MYQAGSNSNYHHYHHQPHQHHHQQYYHGSKAVLSSVLSQLSFQQEVAQPAMPTIVDETGPRKMTLWEGTFNTIWNGLWCHNWEDQDFYYDAVEEFTERSEMEDDLPGVCPASGSSSSASAEECLDAMAFNGSDAHGVAVARRISRGGAQPHRESFHYRDFDTTPRKRAQHQLIPSPQMTMEDSEHSEGVEASLEGSLMDHQEYQQQQQQQSPAWGETSPRQCPLATDHFAPLSPPAPPKELPERFLRAGKGDPVEGRRRYEATLEWRQAERMDSILQEPHPSFELIKANYPHFYHLTGKMGEPVWYEKPPKTNLAVLRQGGVTLTTLLRHYAMATEFGWQFLARDDFARSITVLDLKGMRMMDFVGECVDFVKKCSDFTGQHYPERAGAVIVINVPSWFAMIWKVVQPMIDEVTLKKIKIVRGNAEEIKRTLMERIPLENIPPEYGGTSMPLGQSPEEQELRAMMQHNIQISKGDHSCGGRPNCPYCSFCPVRSY